MMLKAGVNSLMDVILKKYKYACICLIMGTSSVLTVVWWIIWVRLDIMQIGLLIVICGFILDIFWTIPRSYISWILLWYSRPIFWWIHIAVFFFSHACLYEKYHNNWCRCAPVFFCIFYPSNCVYFITFSFK